MSGVYKYEEGGSSDKGPDLVLPSGSTGEVLRTEDGREYVVYENPQTGEQVKVFGVWNEAPGIRMGEGGPRTQVINTEFKYPITQSENGEFILDESQLDVSQRGDGPKMVYDPRFGRKMPVAPTKNLLKQLEQQGPGYAGEDKLSPTVRRGIDMEDGGSTKKDVGLSERIRRFRLKNKKNQHDRRNKEYQELYARHEQIKEDTVDKIESGEITDESQLKGTNRLLARLRKRMANLDKRDLRQMYKVQKLMDK